MRGRRSVRDCVQCQLQVQVKASSRVTIRMNVKILLLQVKVSQQISLKGTIRTNVKILLLLLLLRAMSEVTGTRR